MNTVGRDETSERGSQENRDTISFCRALAFAFVLGAVAVLLGASVVGTAAAQTTTAPDCSTVGYNGAGTASNPFEVSNVSQLQCMGNASTSTSLEDNFTQVSDIDATGTDGWNNGNGFEPIFNDTAGEGLNGTFDGNNNTIAGLTINRTGTDSVGLFKVVNSSGTVTNVKLENAEINGADNVGALVGNNRGGTILSSEASGTVYSGGGALNAGILVGVNEGGGIIKSSEASGTLNAEDAAGGLVGLNKGIIKSSEASGTVNGTNSVGGFVGENFGRINESATTADVFSSGARVGGFAGRNVGSVEDVYARGNVTGGDNVGGVVGVNGESAIGISGTVNRTYATGNVTGNTDVGGVVGFNEVGKVNNSYWDKIATGQTDAVGSSSTSATENNLVGFSSDTDNDGRADEMIGAAAETNMTAFDFTTTWETVIDGYPILSLQAASTSPSSCEVTGAFDGITVTSPGTYTLTQDISASTNCVEIAANDVVFDGNGNSVTGESGNSATGIVLADGVQNALVRDIVVSGWANGIEAGDGSNTIRNITASNNAGDELVVGGSGLSVENLDIGASTAPGTTLSFDATDVTLDSVSNPPLDPEDNESIGRYFDADNTSSNGQLNNLELKYDEADLNGADESTLSLLNFDGTQWQAVPGSSVDEANNVVTADINEFSTFGAFSSSAQLADFGVNITETTSPINAGENLDVSANITNKGGSTDNATVELIVNGTVRDTREKILTPGSSAEIVLTWNTNETDFGDYLAEVNVRGGGADAQRVRVDGPVTDPKFEVDITGTTEPVQAGETLGVETTVKNVGDRKGTQEVELIVDGKERDNETVNLDGGDSSTIALQWDTNESDAGNVLVEVNTTKDRTTRQVSIGPPPTDPVFNVEISDTTDPVQAGETLEAEAFVENVGDTASNGTIALVANGTVQDTETVNLSASGQPGSTDRVVLEWATTEGDAGDRIIEAGATDKRGLNATDVVTVEEPPEDAKFKPAIDFTTSPVVEGDTLAVQADIKNVGDLRGTQEVSLEVGGVERDNQTVTLDGGENRSVVLSWDTASGDAGEYLAEVRTGNGTATEIVTVNEAPEADFGVRIDSTSSPVQAGDTLEVVATVENTGDAAGTETVELIANGSVQDNETVNLGAGDTKQVVLGWGTTGGDAGENFVQVATSNSSDVREVTVESPPTPANFAVDIDRTTSPVVEGDTLEVEASVENTGETAGTGQVVLNVSGERRDSRTVSLNVGESKDVILTWDTNESDAGDRIARVSTRNDTATEVVTVGEAPESRFGVGITDTTEPVTAGETLGVEVLVRNTGDSPGNETVELFANGSVQDSRTVNLDANSNRSIALEWDTTQNDAGDRLIEARTSNASATETVTIGAPPTDADFEVNITGTTEPVQAGETLGVEAVVENTGETEGTATVELIVNGTVRDTDNVTVDGKEKSTIALEWTTTESDAGTFLVEVDTNETTDRATKQVTIGPPPTDATFDMTIDSTTAPVQAGGTLEVDATVENVGETADNGTIELIANGTVQDTETVDLSASGTPGDTDTVALSWDTTEGDAGDRIIQVDTADAGKGLADTQTVEIKEPPEPPTDAKFLVDIVGTTEPVQAGETLGVEALVKNTGETAGTETVELIVNGTVRDTDTVRLDGGDNSTVALEWATTENDAGDRLIEVNATSDRATKQVTIGPPPTGADFEVNITGTTEPTQAGETIGVEAVVENTGETEGTATVELIVNGTARDTDNVTVDGEEKSTIALEWTTTESDAGTFLVEVDTNETTDRATKQVTIGPPPTDAAFDMTIDSTTAPVQAGKTLEVEATVENVGETADNGTIELIANGTVQDTETVDLSASGQPGDTDTVTLSWDTTEEDAGSRIIQVDTADAGKGLADTQTVEIEEPPSAANFAVDIIRTTEPVRAGETLEVEAKVENTGETAGTGTVALNVSGEQRDSTTVDLDPGESSNVVLSWNTNESDAGDTIARVSTSNDTATTPITVGEAPAEADFDVEIDKTTETDAGETLAVQATVTNVGDKPGVGTVALGIDGAERDNETVGLRPGDKRTVVLRWNTTESDAGSYVAEVRTPNDTATAPVTIGAPPTEATFEVEITGTTAPVAAGDELAVEAAVENVGDVAGTGTVELSADGASQDSETVDLDPGENRSVVLLWDTAATEETVGSAVLRVSTSDDTSTRNVEIGDLPTDAKFNVTIDTTTAPVQAGETVEVAATVENVGETPGSVRVDLLADGGLADDKTVSLEPGDSRPVVLRWATQESDVGEFIVTAEGPSLGDTAVVNVKEPPTEAEFEVNVTTTTDPVEEEETLEVAATVENVGETAAILPVSLTVAGQTRDTKDVNLDPGESRPVVLRWTTADGDAGEFIAQVGTPDDGETEIVKIESGNEPPIASFRVVPGVGGENTLSYVSGSIDLDGSIQSYRWDFGDGTSGTGPAPSHTYNRSGDYTVSLTVTDNEGATNTTTSTVAVGEDVLSPNNPFADQNGVPLSRRMVINRVIEWNLNGTINGVSYTRREIINFVIQWNMAT